MDIYCTRPGCRRPLNSFTDLDDNHTLKTVQQKYCTTCGMPLILLGRYLPQKLLGRGGFGAAFLARDRYTPAMRYCVVKQFQPSGDLSPEQLTLAQSLFEREGEVLEQLGNAHAQIPDLFAFFPLAVPGLQPGTQNEFFYLVQEFVDGQNMEEVLAQKGQFSEAEVLEMLLEILKVLQFVHENGSIHRDIKPSNIMRHRNGRFYLLDFGAVKQVTKVAMAGGAKGSTGIYSMGFAPPEQMASSTVFPSTDLYALAVTCITLLTGKAPTDLFDAYSNRWNWRASAQASDRLADVLDRMLLPSPNQRFQTADEVIAALTSKSSGATAKPGAPPAQSAPVAQSAQAVPVVPPVVAAATPLSSPAQAAAGHSAPASSLAPTFSILEILAGAAFTGFEASLVAIALVSLLGTSLLSTGFWLLLIVGLVFAQTRRWIEKIDLVILAGVTLALVVFLHGWRPIALLQASGQPITLIIATAALTGLLAVAVTALFRLIYNLLSRLL